MNYFVHVYEDGVTEVTAVADAEAGAYDALHWHTYYRCQSYDEVIAYLKDMTGCEEAELDDWREGLRKLKPYETYPEPR